MYIAATIATAIGWDEFLFLRILQEMYFARTSSGIKIVSQLLVGFEVNCLDFLML